MRNEAIKVIIFLLYKAHKATKSEIKKLNFNKKIFYLFY